MRHGRRRQRQQLVTASQATGKKLSKMRDGFLLRWPAEITPVIAVDVKEEERKRASETAAPVQPSYLSKPH